MCDRYIRAMLRAATAARLLAGWQGPHGAERTYTVAPSAGPADEWSFGRVMLYVATLEAADIEPRYRESEPERV